MTIELTTIVGVIACSFDSLPDAYTSRGLESVAKLAESLWEDMRTRIAHNVALKCHHFFLVPMYVHLFRSHWHADD
jgi:hypothetical protein